MCSGVVPVYLTLMCIRQASAPAEAAGAAGAARAAGSGGGGGSGGDKLAQILAKKKAARAEQKS